VGSGDAARAAPRLPVSCLVAVVGATVALVAGVPPVADCPRLPTPLVLGNVRHLQRTPPVRLLRRSRQGRSSQAPASDDAPVLARHPFHCFQFLPAVRRSAAASRCSTDCAAAFPARTDGAAAGSWCSTDYASAAGPAPTPFPVAPRSCGTAASRPCRPFRGSASPGCPPVPVNRPPRRRSPGSSSIFDKAPKSGAVPTNGRRRPCLCRSLRCQQPVS